MTLAIRYAYLIPVLLMAVFLLNFSLRKKKSAPSFFLLSLDRIDRYGVGGAFHSIGHLTQISSALLRKIQTGFLRHALLVILLGLIFLFFLESKI